MLITGSASKFKNTVTLIINDVRPRGLALASRSGQNWRPRPWYGPRDTRPRPWPRDAWPRPRPSGLVVEAEANNLNIEYLH